MSEALSDAELCEKGLALLHAHLGPVEALRFLALISHQRFDYQRWREQHFGDMSVDEILTHAQEHPP